MTKIDELVFKMLQFSEAKIDNIENNGKIIITVKNNQHLEDFLEILKENECWETLCLNNSHCDTFEDNSNIKPYCLECKKDCPNKILIDNL